MLTILSFCVGLIFAKPISAESTWIDAVIELKAKSQKALQDAKMPIETAWIKVKEKAVAVSADLKGQDRLVLMTSGGPDGTNTDWGTWANARLIKADGTSVWLDELTQDYGTTNLGRITKNVDNNGNALTIAGKKYEHGVMSPGNSVLVYNINKQFVRFEAEVGITDQSMAGSVYFKILNVYPREEIADILGTYTDKAGYFSHVINGLENWVLTKDASIEKAAILRMTSGLKDNSYFKNEVSRIDKENADTQARSYLNLFEKARRVCSINDELEWLNVESVKMAFENMKSIKGFDVNKYQPMLNELEQLAKAGFDGIYSANEDAMARVEKAVANKRAILLANPLLDGDKVVATRFKMGTRAYRAMAPDLGTQSNNWSNQQSARRFGFEADIIELSNLRGDVKTRSVYKSDNLASIADLKLHWGGDKVMFTSLTADRRWNVFEVKLDGSGFHPVIETTEPDLEFYDGTYLPDGRIIANSNIGYQGVPCVNGSDPVGNMVLFNPNNKNIRRLTFDQDANWNPVIMHNGRVMYTRWEYTDLTHYFSRIVMHMNPDGTENKALFGSGSMFPNSTFDIQPLPGHSSAFVGVISGHHGIARSGRLLLFDPTKARKGVEGIIQEIPFRERTIIPEIKDELVNGVWPQFLKPTPLDDKYYLVSAKLNENDLWGLYLVDVFDNVTCLMKTEGTGYISPIVVRKNNTPPVIPDRVNLNSNEATVFIQDIYEGEGLRGVPRGQVKSLRVHAYEYAYLNTPSDHTAQGIQSGWDIKRLLGTVPVEEDGSVIFKIPANTPVSIQPLDESGAAIQWMRSWLTGMPGEIVSCIGCHEDQNQIPIPKRVIASQKAPVKLTEPEGGVRSFTFDYEVQPVLDRACVACHTGEGRAFDLRGGVKDTRGYGTSYLNLHPYVHRQGPEADMIVLKPYEYHVNTSDLVRMLRKGHFNVELTDQEWRVLYNWIDYNVPDKGRFAANPQNGYDQIARRIELTNKYGNGASVDWQKELADYADFLKGKGDITPVRPERSAPAKEKAVKVDGWPLDADAIKKMLSSETETRKVVQIAPGMNMTFVRIPAGTFAMGSSNGDSDNRPVSKVKIEKPFWMAEIEVTNAQYNVIFPKHDSRYVDQHWKDHTRPGYEANKPEQPVIRVSYQDAMAYGEQLGEKIGLKLTLPTEAQWEWACRAGSDSDFWFGNMNTDFGKFENFADEELNKMAVSGVDPQPMRSNNGWYKYYTFLPKEESVNDGNMLQVDSKLYAANPFGLHSMHGNIAEWTRSDYVPYPYSEKSKVGSEYKVVRGGSYIDRPKFSTAYTRKPYYPWQCVHNVGFRIVIED